MKKLISLCSMMVIALTMSGCFLMTPTGINSEQQQTFAKETTDSTLKELYKWQPEAKKVVDNSKGYVVYNIYTFDVFFLGVDTGWAIAYNKKTGEYSYLKDLSFAVGPALGIANMRNVFVFDNEIEFNSFLANGWNANLKADAVARFSEDGTWDVAGGVNITNGATYYKIGRRGLIAEAMFDVGKTSTNHSLTTK
jgi:hypothetical protein